MRNKLKSSAAARILRRQRVSYKTAGSVGVCAATSSAWFTGTASASDKLVLVPDFDLFNLFGQSQFGDLWIMLIGFVLLIFPLNELIFKPIFHSLDARAEKIDGARKRSGELQVQADDVLERYETAIREARSDSEQARQAGLLAAREEQATLTSEARGQAERELETARAELGESLEEARASLRASAESLAEAAAAQVLGRALT